MNETDKVKMILNIGGQHLSLSVDFKEQNAVRDAEKIAADKFDEFRQQYRSMSDNEIMAMVAYQIAWYYLDLYRRHREAVRMAEEVDAMLGTVLRQDTPPEA